ncbi:GTP pyrophosphokinase [Marinomonas posidonica]|uniref:RelA/SpoT domain protein n=1 Tax=Marinomonas posidonica (strain CECT 7376 / NCIMB 14433 / IVIA-Po-181) TaxID=491952 RepID=F6CYH2_MARPP|nr:RelA/SpoT domain-containing protein [Marinomonas posidonica]AEF54581.1 RelA/SpoT domain protein [Marinomonas posidonica IVIA-Po-181]
MNEEEFIKRWNEEIDRYKAWGDFVKNEILKTLTDQGKNINSFLKVPASCRIKEEASLIDKAFYRGNKSYDDPYNQIEDKVGIRFITLLLEDVKEICTIIEESQSWTIGSSRDFHEERNKSPLIFDYQSMHYVLRPTGDFLINDIEVQVDTPCEVQVRTLLQHAYAELTHDALYKIEKKEDIDPNIHRKVARSMALIETTDEYFGAVNNEINISKFEKYNIKSYLDNLYYVLIEVPPIFEKSSIIIWNSYNHIIDENLAMKIETFFQKETMYIELIKDKANTKPIFRQSIIFFLIWLSAKFPEEIENEWPISFDVIKDIQRESGLSYFRD